MRPITRALVDEVVRELTAYPPGQVKAEADAFLGRQPHVAAFADVVTRDLEDEPARQAALGLAFLLFKILERSLGGPFPLLAGDRIRIAYGAHAADSERRAEGLEGSAHPTLIAYIMSVFYEGHRAAAEYDPRVKASFSLLLRTLTEALDLGEVEPGEVQSV